MNTAEMLKAAIDSQGGTICINVDLARRLLNQVESLQRLSEQQPAIVVNNRKVVGINPAEGTRIAGEFYAEPKPSRIESPFSPNPGERSDVYATWYEFWAPIILDENQNINFYQVMCELHDYHFLLQNVPKVYDHVTGGSVSQPNTTAEAVIAEYNQHRENEISEPVQASEPYGYVCGEWFFDTQEKAESYQRAKKINGESVFCVKVCREQVTHNKAEVPDAEQIAAFIREIDGNHTMGASALADAFCERFFSKFTQLKGDDK